MKNNTIRIMLVDDHSLVREFWKMLLQRDSAFEVIADCDNGHAAIEVVTNHSPEIMLVDINMSPMNGFDVTEQALKIKPTLKVIGISVHNDPRYALRLMQLGAMGYITKTSSLEEIRYGILEVNKGTLYICDEVKRKMSIDARK